KERRVGRGADSWAYEPCARTRPFLAFVSCSTLERQKQEQKCEQIGKHTTRLLNAVPEPTPTPLLSILMPPLPPLIPASSILPICLCGVLYFLVLSFICLIYAAFITGRKLQLCLTRPVCTVVRARGLCGSVLLGSGIFGRSAMTIWFSTLSLTMSSSYTSGWISLGLVLYAEFGPNEG